MSVLGAWPTVVALLGGVLLGYVLVAWAPPEGTWWRRPLAAYAWAVVFACVLLELAALWGLAGAAGQAVANPPPPLTVRTSGSLAQLPFPTPPPPTTRPPFRFQFPPAQIPQFTFPPLPTPRLPSPVPGAVRYPASGRDLAAGQAIRNALLAAVAGAVLWPHLRLARRLVEEETARG